MIRGLFITGTDTGVGKTVVTAALAGALRRRGLDVGVMKPVQTGAVETAGGRVAPDARFLTAAAGIEDPAELVCPVLLREPLAPSVAAEREGSEVSLQAVLDAFTALQARHRWVLVEGAGGIAVPIRGGYLMADLARGLGLPVLIVARPSLGTINHTLLTVSFARAAGLQVLGVVIGNHPPPERRSLAETTSPDVIAALAQVPVLGFVPEDASVDTDRGEPGHIVQRMLENPLLERIHAALLA